MTNLEIFYANAQNSGNLSHFHGTRTLILSWMHVKRIPGNGPRKEDLPLIYWIPQMHKIHINTDSLRVHRSARPSLYPFYSQNCLHILSKVDLQKYCETAYSRSGVNQMWILKRKRKRSDSVLWHQQKCQKGKVTTQQRHKKVRLHSGCGLT